MKIEKYFWDLNPAAAKDVRKVLADPAHPSYIVRIRALLSRCDRPRELFSFISQDQFVENWPRIRSDWNRSLESQDFKAWWETIYEQILKKQGVIKKIKGEPVNFLKQFGDLIKKHRIAAGWSQSDFAQRIRLSQPAVSAVEKGRKNITLLTALRMLRILGIQSLPVE